MIGTLLIIELPDIARLANRRSGGDGFRLIGPFRGPHFPKHLNGEVDFREAEASDRQVEVDVEVPQFEEILAQQRSSQ